MKTFANLPTKQITPDKIGDCDLIDIWKATKDYRIESSIVDNVLLGYIHSKKGKINPAIFLDSFNGPHLIPGSF